ncbi:hypothetical protein GQX73_g4853 [Xylaria multiplex]|uniref:Uncharacterized protein n=1 Tax=Xylaria multiplex TaxID=323545 RepID=A0A7C8MV28_9PEZI|nr:hypothetical protein GQX73_g4853 [Xylaria multiplex]
MATDAPDSLLFKSAWPNNNRYLTPKFLDSLRKRLVRLRSRFRDLMEKQDSEDEFDLDGLVRVSEPTFRTIEYIAQEAPPLDPVDPDLAAITSALDSQLQAIIGDSKTPYSLPKIPALPNPEWDAIFQGFCKLLEAIVDAYIIGDNPVYNRKFAISDTPDPTYRLLYDLVDRLNRYPFLRAYHKSIVGKLGCSRSGAAYTQYWLKESTLKRKTDEHDLSDAKKRRLEENIKMG